MISRSFPATRTVGIDPHSKGDGRMNGTLYMKGRSRLASEGVDLIEGLIE